MIKLCVNCTHLSGTSCLRKSWRSPIDGHTEFKPEWAHEERSVPIFFDIIMHACGARGRFFHQKVKQ